ncbi:hypothetical protein MMC22_008413 [Lobaria immixta]|nr:hypothetical protein [Lobaria immixta]
MVAARKVSNSLSAAQTAAKDPGAQPHFEPEARKELSRPKVRDILRLHQNFAFGSTWDAKELRLLIFKPYLNLRVPFEFETDLSSFWGSPPGGDPVTLQGLKLAIDETALHV